jgi:hypothetical protein
MRERDDALRRVAQLEQALDERRAAADGDLRERVASLERQLQVLSRDMATVHDEPAMVWAASGDDVYHRRRRCASLLAATSGAAARRRSSPE